MLCIVICFYYYCEQNRGETKRKPRRNIAEKLFLYVAQFIISTALVTLPSLFLLFSRLFLLDERKTLALNFLSFGAFVSHLIEIYFPFGAFHRIRIFYDTFFASLFCLGKWMFYLRLEADSIIENLFRLD